jgi:hypothetical protein
VNIDWINFRLASTISPHLLNEARYQWGRDNEFQFSQPPLAGEPTNSVGGRSPQTFLTNGFSFGIPEFLERVAFPDERRNQFADAVQKSPITANLVVTSTSPRTNNLRLRRRVQLHWWR